MKYQPHPIDLSGVKLDEKLQADIETISRNIHETWANQRMQAGWVYGDEVDLERKTHRCLVEYNELPESEKDVDRATVTQTIKMLLNLGYEIKKKGE